MRKTITIGGRQFKLKKETDDLLEAVWTFGEYSLICEEHDVAFAYILEPCGVGPCEFFLRVLAPTELEARKKLNTLLAGGWLGVKWT